MPLIINSSGTTCDNNGAAEQSKQQANLSQAFHQTPCVQELKQHIASNLASTSCPMHQPTKYLQQYLTRTSIPSSQSDLPRRRPWFFSVRGFHVNLVVHSWFGIFPCYLCWLSHHLACYWSIPPKCLLVWMSWHERHMCSLVCWFEMMGLMF